MLRRCAATPSPIFANAYASALDVNQFARLNAGASTAVQALDLYAHAKVTGEMGCPYDGHGSFRWGVSLYRFLGDRWYLFGSRSKTARWNPPGCEGSHPSAEVRDRMRFDLHVPPASIVGRRRAQCGNGSRRCVVPHSAHVA